MNSLEVVRRDKDPSMNGVTEKMIVDTGKLDIVKFFVQNGYQMTGVSTQFAAKHGHVDFLKYLC